MSDPDSQQNLIKLLAQGERYAPTYGNGLSNHLPMVLIALQRLGAPGAELDAHAKRYAKRLEPLLASDFVIDPAKPDAHLGDWSAFGAYRTFFHGELERQGIDKALARWWPMLVPGIAAAGFHALIRLAYALEVDHRGEAATALAYMASTFTVLYPEASNSPAKVENTTAALEAMHRVFADRVVEADLIIEELQLATEEKDFFTALRVPPVTSEEDRRRMRSDLARIAIRIYLSRPSFSSLHLVTGTHALSIVLAHLPADQHPETLFFFWVAFCAGYVSIRAPKLVECGPGSEVDWEKIAAKVRKSGNEHSIKLLYSCRAEFQQTHDSAYLIAAARLAA
jgi:hypothetical protein